MCGICRGQFRVDSAPRTGPSSRFPSMVRPEQRDCVCLAGWWPSEWVSASELILKSCQLQLPGQVVLTRVLSPSTALQSSCLRVSVNEHPPEKPDAGRFAQAWGFSVDQDKNALLGCNKNPETQRTHGDLFLSWRLTQRRAVAMGCSCQHHPSYVNTMTVTINKSVCERQDHRTEIRRSLGRQPQRVWD